VASPVKHARDLDRFATFPIIDEVLAPQHPAQSRGRVRYRRSDPREVDEQIDRIFDRYNDAVGGFRIGLRNVFPDSVRSRS